MCIFNENPPPPPPPPLFPPVPTHTYAHLKNHTSIIRHTIDVSIFHTLITIPIDILYPSVTSYQNRTCQSRHATLQTLLSEKRALTGYFWVYFLLVSFIASGHWIHITYCKTKPRVPCRFMFGQIYPVDIAVGVPAFSFFSPWASRLCCNCKTGAKDPSERESHTVKKCLHVRSFTCAHAHCGERTRACFENPRRRPASQREADGSLSSSSKWGLFIIK